VSNDILRETSVSFSQNGEDIVISLILGNERHNKGMVLDIGAHHPFRFSNTYMLYLEGWRGVNIDPNSDLIDLFKRYRPEDKSLAVAVGTKPGTVRYFKYEEGAYNNIRSDDENEVWGGHPPSRLISEETVECMSVHQILEEHVGSKKFDLLNIDIEGKDLEVLQAIDFNRFRPKAITVELFPETWNLFTFQQFLGKIRYRYFAHCYSSLVLIRED
jgi:FkbM family methyltransferase